MFYPGGSRWFRVPALLLLVGLVLASCNSGGSSRGAGPVISSHILLVEVYANGLAPGESDQFVRLYNPAPVAADLSGWTIGGGKVRAVFPTGAHIGAGQTLYAARDAAGFARVMGAPPDYVWVPASGGTARAMLAGAGLLMGRSSGSAVLRDAQGTAIDTVVYGAASPVAGWSGPPAPPPQPGEILDRARDESTWGPDRPGTYARDTNTAADWKQGSGWVDQRFYRPGQTWFGAPAFLAKSVLLYASPDSSFVAVTGLLDSAQKQIDMNMYEFTLAPVAEKLAAAARRGVKVRLLMEGDTPNRLTNYERYVAKLVSEAGGEVRWMRNDSAAGIRGRYVYNHAKYAVVDGQYAMVQSENIVRFGVPISPSDGNRGWGAVVEDRPLAAYMTRVFEADWNPLMGDVVSYQPGTPFGPPTLGFVPDSNPVPGRYPHPFPPMRITSPVPVTPVLAPDHSLLQSRGIVGLIRSARQSLLIEQQYI